VVGDADERSLEEETREEGEQKDTEQTANPVPEALADQINWDNCECTEDGWGDE